jgi:hypothetical protein
MEPLLVLAAWLWSEFHWLIIALIVWFVLWHLMLMPIIRAVEKAREERETQSNDRHLELMNALKSLDDILEELKLHLPNNVRSKRAGKSRQTTTENDIKKQAEGRLHQCVQKRHALSESGGSAWQRHRTDRTDGEAQKPMSPMGPMSVAAIGDVPAGAELEL